MTRLIILLTLVGVSAGASAKELLLCQSPGKADIVISLKDRQAFRHNLDCISGDFISDMTPCAPDGGFGLSAPTGSAALVAVVDRWQDYIDHLGAVAGHYIIADKIYFSGGFNGPSNGYVENWTFTASRITGQAELKVKDKPTVVYSCGKSKPRF